MPDAQDRPDTTGSEGAAAGSANDPSGGVGVLSEAAVEAAAKAHWERSSEKPWEDLAPPYRDYQLQSARDALAAAEPLMRAEWEATRWEAFRADDGEMALRASTPESARSRQRHVERLEALERGWKAEQDDLMAENARLRETLETVLRDWVHCRDIGMDRWGNFVECGKCAPCKATADARGVLAPSTEEGT